MEREQQSKNSGSKLDTGNSERSVWLMKCPVTVSNTWKSAVDNQPLSKVIDNDRGVLMRHMPGMIGLIASNSSKDKRKATPMKGSGVKRTRRDHGELEDIMFKLFERHPNWTLKAVSPGDRSTCGISCNSTFV